MWRAYTKDFWLQFGNFENSLERVSIFQLYIHLDNYTGKHLHYPVLSDPILIDNKTSNLVLFNANLLMHLFYKKKKKNISIQIYLFLSQSNGVRKFSIKEIAKLSLAPASALLSRVSYFHLIQPPTPTKESLFLSSS